jgi:hypothetical protein
VDGIDKPEPPTHKIARQYEANGTRRQGDQ